MEAPEGLWGGGPGSDVLGDTVDSLGAFASDQGPNLIHLMNRKLAPGSVDSDTPRLTRL